MQKRFLIMLAGLLATLLVGTACGLASVKNIAKTVDDAAEIACGVFADTHGLTVEDICNTKEDLQPYIDAILSADRVAGAMHGVSMEDKADGGS